MTHLPYGFDLLYDIKTYEALSDEMSALYSKLKTLERMCAENRIVYDYMNVQQVQDGYPVYVCCIYPDDYSEQKQNKEALFRSEMSEDLGS